MPIATIHIECTSCVDCPYAEPVRMNVWRCTHAPTNGRLLFLSDGVPLWCKWMTDSGVEE